MIARRTALGEVKPKDLLGTPWLLAFALRADGWWLRGCNIWAKPNAMPESAKDRCTTAHSYVFHFAKSARYFFDGDAISEPYSESTIRIHGSPGVQARAGEWKSEHVGQGHSGLANGEARGVPRRTPQDETLNVHIDPDCPRRMDGWHPPPPGTSRPKGECICPPEAPRGPDGRRVTHVQAGRTQSNTETAIARLTPLALLAPSGPSQLKVFLKPTSPPGPRRWRGGSSWRRCRSRCARCAGRRGIGSPRRRSSTRRPRTSETRKIRTDGVLARFRRGQYHATNHTLGFTDCGHNAYVPGTVLDPFGGSGTTAFVARKLNRRAILIELNEDYRRMAAERTKQLSLLA